MEKVEGIEEKKGGKDNKVKFRPGTIAVKIHVTQKTRPGVKHFFTHDQEATTSFGRLLARTTHPTELRISHEPQEYEAFEERILRLWFAAMAKKLAVSLGPEAAFAHGGGLNRVGRLAVGIPPGLVPIVDSYGKVSTDVLNWEMVGQACWSLSFYGRACAPDLVVYQGVNQAVDRVESFFVNVAANRPFEPLKELLIGIISAWAVNAAPAQFGVGGQNFTMAVPRPVAGMAGYTQLVANIQKPVLVTWALACAVIVEASEVIGAAALNAAQVGALNAQRVIMCVWNGADYDQMNGEYYAGVESRVVAPLSEHFGWVRLEGLKAHGSAMQLVRRETAFMGFSPVQIPGDALDIGWTMGGTNVGHFPSTQTFSISGEKTSLERATELMEGLGKRKH